MTWNVEVTDECKAWLEALCEEDFDAIDYSVGLLSERGPQLDYPHSSKVNGSRHEHMRELRVQSGGRPIRIFYAFDPRRSAILLIGGDKIGDKRFYERLLPLADRLYDVYLIELKKEGLIS
jgi:hypothetical protein